MQAPVKTLGFIQQNVPCAFSAIVVHRGEYGLKAMVLLQENNVPLLLGMCCDLIQMICQQDGALPHTANIRDILELFLLSIIIELGQHTLLRLILLISLCETFLYIMLQQSSSK